MKIKAVTPWFPFVSGVSKMPLVELGFGFGQPVFRFPLHRVGSRLLQTNPHRLLSDHEGIHEGSAEMDVQVKFKNDESHICNLN